MKKIVLWGLLVVTIAGVALFVFQEPLKQGAYNSVTENMFVTADDDAFDPGPAVGSLFPGVRATYQGRDINLINEFYGSKGTVFVAVRSAQWCPYCMKQMTQLQEYKHQFDAAGIALVAMTYDDPSLQNAFVSKWGIEYPLLHDVETLTFKTLGILNAEQQPGERGYGIPYPGMIVINTDGVVVGKLFLEGYSVRVDAPSSLAFAQQVLGLEMKAGAGGSAGRP